MKEEFTLMSVDCCLEAYYVDSYWLIIKFQRRIRKLLCKIISSFFLRVIYFSWLSTNTKLEHL